jgi:hypothetical protein
MILQSIAPEARSSATDYVADVTDVRETEVRQCPMPSLADALLPKKMREQSTIADCPRLPIL